MASAFGGTAYNITDMAWIGPHGFKVIAGVETVAYSAYIAFDILAKIVEIVADQDYEDFLQENIFAPCHMKDTTFVPSKEQWNICR